jgi:hypothetical protein
VGVGVIVIMEVQMGRFLNPWNSKSFNNYNSELFDNNKVINGDNVTVDNVTKYKKKTFKYSSKFEWYEKRALIIIESLMNTLGITRANAFLIVAQSAAESGYGNPISNNYFGIGGVNKKSYKNFDECFIDFQSLINSKWPNYFSSLKIDNLDSDKINKALNSGPYIKPGNWFKDSLYSYNIDLDDSEPLKLKIYDQFNKKTETYNDNGIIFSNVHIRITSGMKNYGKLILDTYETAIKIAKDYYDYKYESCLEIIFNNKEELKKTGLTATRRKQLNNEIEAKEKEKWDYPQMAHTVSLFKIIDKGTKISSNKIHQDENVFASYKDNIVYIKSKWN